MVCKDNSTEKKQRIVFQICCKVAEGGNQTQGLEPAATCAGSSKGDSAALQPRLSQRMLAAYSPLGARVQTEMAITRISQEHKIRAVCKCLQPRCLLLPAGGSPGCQDCKNNSRKRRGGGPLASSMLPFQPGMPSRNLGLLVKLILNLKTYPGQEICSSASVHYLGD